MEKKQKPHNIIVFLLKSATIYNASRQEISGKAAETINPGQKEGEPKQMKNSFYVIEERHTKTGKTYAHAETINNAHNLVYKFQPRPNFEIVSINAADTKKQAEEIAEFWNEGAKTRGKYYFN